MTIPTQTCVAGFIVSMGTLEQTVKGVHYVRARVDVDAPVNDTVGPGRPAGRIYFFLYVYGDAAERVSRRFRKGDVFVASGRVGYAPSTGSVFVADRIGHSASADQAQQDHDDCDDDQDVDEAANGEGSDKAKQPKDDEHDGDCIKHDNSSFKFSNADG